MLQKYFAQIAINSPSLAMFTVTTTNTLFWMDTLCIPVQTAPPAIPIPEEVLQDVKEKAIDKMNIVYSSSSHTLVLDAELRAIPMASNHTTKLAYIQYCGWTTRSWTLQEGCLPPSTVYAFSDGIYSHESAQLDVPQLPPPARGVRGLPTGLVDPEYPAQQFNSLVQREIWKSSPVQYPSIWDPLEPGPSRNRNVLVRDRFARVWNELLDRVSSLPADTPAIFANLLSVSAYEVLKRKTEQERIALIIRQQKVLPVELLFNTGPRLQGRLSMHLSESRARSQMQQHVTTQESTSQERIGLLEMSVPLTQSFKNGWVPASIRGDKCSRPLATKYYLQVLEHSLRLYHNDFEAIPFMYTVTSRFIPISTFVLDSRCDTISGHVATRASRTFITIKRLVDDSLLNTEDRLQETVLGHCFMYDPGLMRDMCHGRIDYAPGCHLVILSRSDGRIVTRYSSPIKLGQCTEETQKFRRFPKFDCQCTCHNSLGIKDFVDILYGKSDIFVRQLLFAHQSSQADIQSRS